MAWFVSTHTVAVTVLAPLVAAGPTVAALAGAGAGGALSWIVGLLAGLGLTEYVAKRYAGRKTQAPATFRPDLRLPPTTGRRTSRPRGRRRSIDDWKIRRKEKGNAITDYRSVVGSGRWRRILWAYPVGLWRGCGRRTRHHTIGSPRSLPIGHLSLRARRQLR
jgi:hypothetical protein